jgi:release factor glutamine methyltransferase
MLQMLVIKAWLAFAAQQLSDLDIDTARLDAEIILANILNVDRTYLHAHSEQELDPKQYKLANHNLQLRLRHMPVAYITGQKEFYGRQFIVNKNVLIPRPESETMVESLKSIIGSLKPNEIINLVDIGTGSGCLGITAKLEIPQLNVTLIDISSKALKVAKLNAKSLSAEIDIKKSNLLKKYNQTADIIIANLPYVDKIWDRSPETDYEPRNALFAADKGLATIKKLINESNNKLTIGGYLILEAEPHQHLPIIEYAQKSGLKIINQTGFIATFKKSR